MTMRERLARAIASQRWIEYDDLDFDLASAAQRQDLMREADAVLDALREPTEVMIEAGLSEGFGLNVAGQNIYRSALRRAWPVMIDAAKEER